MLVSYVCVWDKDGRRKKDFRNFFCTSKPTNTKNLPFPKKIKIHPFNHSIIQSSSSTKSWLKSENNESCSSSLLFTLSHHVYIQNNSITISMIMINPNHIKIYTSCFEALFYRNIGWLLYGRNNTCLDFVVVKIFGKIFVLAKSFRRNILINILQRYM